MRAILLVALLPILLAALLPGAARAETLADAIAAAYSANPEITAARAQVRATDESVVAAKSGGRPSLDLNGGFTNQMTERFGDYGRMWTGGIQLTQPVWQAGRVRSGISAAEARVEAARARLEATEHGVVTDTVTAYANVLRMQAIVELNENQVHVLEQQLQAAKDRFEVGDLTRTDVAQSEARLSAARATLTGVLAEQIAAREAYQRLVGRPPVGLEPLPDLPPLPATEAEVLALARDRNPDLLAARLDEKAAREDVSQAKAQHGPSVNATAAAAYSHMTGRVSGREGFAPQVGVAASLPLFNGGLIASNVRAAQARQSAALERITLTEREIAEDSANSYARLRAAEAVIDSSQTLVSANTLAAEGVKQENLVGSRDILDVLNAEQELLNAQVLLVTAERDRYVAGFTLLEVTGSFEVVLADAPVSRYDPTINTRRVNRKAWSPFGYDPDPRGDGETGRDVAPLTAAPAGPPPVGPQLAP